jgi:hypothetical protein
MIDRTDRKKTGIREMNFRGKYFSKTIPATSGRNSLKKGADFHTGFTFLFARLVNG